MEKSIKEILEERKNRTKGNSNMLTITFSTKKPEEITAIKTILNEIAVAVGYKNYTEATNIELLLHMANFALSGIRKVEAKAKANK